MTRVVLFFAVLLLPALVAASQIDFDQKLYDSVEAGDITAMQNVDIRPVAETANTRNNRRSPPLCL